MAQLFAKKTYRFSHFIRRLVLPLLVFLWAGSSVFATNYLAPDSDINWPRLDDSEAKWKTQTMWWGDNNGNPSTTSDNVYISGNRAITLKLQADITINEIDFSYSQGGLGAISAGSNIITIDLNGHNFTCNNMILSNGNDRPSNVRFIDSTNSGKTVTVNNKFDFADNVTSTLSINNGIKLDVKNGYQSSSGSGGLTISGDGSADIKLPPEAYEDPKLDLGIFIWTGDAGDSEWNTPGNWQKNTVPNSDDALVSFPTTATVNVDSAITVKNLSIGANVSFNNFNNITYSKLSVTDNAILSLDSAFTIDSKLNPASSGIIETSSNITGFATAFAAPALSFKADNITTNADFECNNITATSTLTLGGTLTTTGNISCNYYEGTTAVGVYSHINCAGDFFVQYNAMFRGNVSAKNLSVGYETSLGDRCSNITTEQNQTYKGTVKLLLTGSGVLLRSSNKGSVYFKGDVINWDGGEIVPHSLTIGDSSNRTNVEFNGNIGTSTSLLDSITIYGDTTVSFAGNNTFNNLTISGKSQVSFAAGSKQIINGTLSLSGLDAEHPLLFGSAGASQWKIQIPSVSDSNLNYVHVINSKSVDGSDADKNLGLTPSKTHAWSNRADNTGDWFAHKYYWIGNNEGDWGTETNWFYDAAGKLEAPIAPAGEHLSDIYVVSGNPLLIGQDAAIKSLTVYAGATAVIGNVTLDSNDIINNGRIVMPGTNTLTVSGTKTNGADSVIEYTGNCSSLPWGTEYDRVVFADGSNCNSTNNLTFNGTVTINSGTGNSISLNGNNTFNAPVTITSAGDVSLKGTGLVIAADAVCDSLTVNSAVT
ncbi:MAG: hypothetical protein MJ179_09800, partial [Treponema sp.]|nr:hypothetical protein [Treponema sp.]